MTLKFQIIDRSQKGFARYCPTISRELRVMARKSSVLREAIVDRIDEQKNKQIVLRIHRLLLSQEEHCKNCPKDEDAALDYFWAKASKPGALEQ